MNLQQKLNKRLGINTANDRGVWIKSTRTLRHLIGVLGMMLPILLLVFSNNCQSAPLESISHYYYTTAGSFFTVILSLVALFLIIYTKDFKLSSVAGIAALCVVFFPTDSLGDTCSIVNYPGDTFRVKFHYFSAAVFLAILGFMSMFHFTKLDDEEKQLPYTKVNYSWVYKLCGALVFFAIAFIGFYALVKAYFNNHFVWFISFYNDHQLTFWMEVLALEAFGTAWLVKGRNTPTQEEILAYR